MSLVVTYGSVGRFWHGLTMSVGTWTCVMRAFCTLAVFGLLVVVACGGATDESRDGSEAPSASVAGTDSTPPTTPETSVEATSPSVTPSASEPATTAELQSFDGLFIAAQVEVQESAMAIAEITQQLADSIDVGFDAEMAEALTAEMFQLLDPVYPQFGFSSIADYYSYLSEAINTEEVVVEVLVNADSSLTMLEWPTFLRTDPAGIDAPLAGARHLLIVNGQITTMTHLFEQADARKHAEGISKTIGFESAGIPLATSVTDINAQADAAIDLGARWSAAWTAHDASAVRDLYGDEAVRYDEFAGSPRSPDEAAAWATELFTAYPDLAVTVDGTFAGGLGPAVLADFTTTVNDAPCTIRVGVIWTVSNDLEIQQERVHYDPTTLVDCGWLR